MRVPNKKDRLERQKKTRRATDDRRQAAAKQRWLGAFVRLGTVTHACRASKVSSATHYRWLSDDEEYAQAARKAEEEAHDALERLARQRAFRGSDTLLIFLLKAARPHKFAERWQGKLDAAVLGGTVDLDAIKHLSTPELETLRGLLRRVLGIEGDQAALSERLALTSGQKSGG